MSKHQERLEIIRTDADGFSSLSPGCGLIVLEISRREIQSGNISSALERLQMLVDDRDAIINYRESLAIMVAGYNNDQRELAEIPEVRAFFAKLSAQWPHWFWMLARGMGGISLLLSLLCSVKIHRAENQSGLEFLDEQEMGARINDLLNRSFALCNTFGITEDEFEASMHSGLSELAAPLSS